MQERAASQPQPIGLDTLMVFILSGWDSRVAAEFDLRKLQRLQKELDAVVDDSLVARVENACLGMDDAQLASLFENLDADGLRAAARAVKHCVEHHLYKYTVEQNCDKGCAPTRAQLAEAGFHALATLPSEVPQQIVARLRSLLGGDARSLRRWLASWRKRWGGRLGRLQVSEQLPTHVVANKAGKFILSVCHAVSCHTMTHSAFAKGNTLILSA